MTKNQAEEAYKNDNYKTEFVASLVSVPIGITKVKVTFPESHLNMVPSPSAVAFYGEREVLHKEETERISTDLVLVDRVATLTVHNPSVGLKYGVAWMPPDR